MATSELDVLIDREIPDGRKSLQDSYTNLQRVAQYCENNYLQAADKRQALDETKNYTTHSLASVAYQVNNLATNFLKLLDLQQNQLAEMESSVNHLAQIVNIHKEKVARREIGVLTTNRNAARPLGVKSGIIFPEQAERPIKYTRKPIDYNALDEVGHGVKSQSAAASSANHRPQRSSSISSTGSSNAPTTMPPTPPVNRNPQQQQQNYGTIGRASNSSQYRALTNAPPVAPPLLPTQQSSIYGVMGRGQQPGRASQAYNPSSAITGQVNQVGGPIIGMARPISSSSMGHPPSAMAGPHRYPHDPSDASLPPPPPEDSLLEEASPPLPPPPEEGQPGMFSYPGAAPPPPPGFNDGGMQGAPMMDEDPYAATGNQYITQSQYRPPDAYLEKVVAIYDYEAVKNDELSFMENAVIYVIKKNDDGWWEGVMDGVTGLFPSNYVEPCI